jgi:Tol biopolymer transport system component
MRLGRLCTIVVAGVLVSGLGAAPPGASASAGESHGGGSHGGRSPGVIAFSDFVDDVGSGDAQVFVVNPDGTGERQLTHVPEGKGAGSPAFSPDGRRIAYLSNENSDNYAVWVMDADGSDQRVLLAQPGYDFGRPGWSPDGRSLVASRCERQDIYTIECDLVTFRADGSRPRVLLSNERNNRDPAWSPDGRWIAFGTDRDGYQSTIAVMPASGGTPRQVTPGPLSGYWPDWSPDGRRLLFSNHCCVPDSDLFTVRPDGSRLTQVTDVVGSEQAFAAYSPDGSRVVYYDTTGEPPDSDTGAIYTMRADGTDARLLVADHPYAILSDWGPSPRGHAHRENR